MGPRGKVDFDSQEGAGVGVAGLGMGSPTQAVYAPLPAALPLTPGQSIKLMVMGTVGSLLSTEGGLQARSSGFGCVYNSKSVCYQSLFSSCPICEFSAKWQPTVPSVFGG